MYISVINEDVMAVRQFKLKINTDFIAILNEDTRSVVLSSGNEIYLSEKDYNEVEAALFPKKKKVASVNTDKAEFLNQLHMLTGGKTTAILTPERQRKLDKLLLTFSKEQLITAATNLGQDKWLQGENDNKKRYGTIDFLLRPEKAAQWAEYKPEDKRRPLF